jgi:hypothetical protein
MIEIYHGLYPLLPVENINNDTLEYSRVKATMVYIFCALAESLIFLLHLINTNKVSWRCCWGSIRCKDSDNDLDIC